MIMVDHLLRYHIAAEEMIKAVKEGEIGDICYIHGQRIGGKVRAHENVLWSLGPHDLSLTFALIGPEVTILDISARGRSYLKENEGVEDVVFSKMRFSNGAMANFHFSWMDRYKERRFVVVGSEGTVIFDDLAPEPLQFYPPRKTPPMIFKEPRPLDRACQHFIDCYITLDEPKTNTRDAVAIVQALEYMHLQIKGSLW